MNDKCPGCGNGPGDGLNPNCNDPEGCGYWRELYAEWEREKASQPPPQNE